MPFCLRVVREQESFIKDENYLKRLKLNSSEQLIGSMCSGALIVAALGF